MAENFPTWTTQPGQNKISNYQSWKQEREKLLPKLLGTYSVKNCHTILTVKNLGVLFDSDIKNIPKTGFYHLKL